jgi:type I restriction enzyme S subunit
MKSNYKKIGEHIRLVDERNKGLQGKQLLGLSISKQFIPSVANIIGTDMENYKIIRRNQFACSTMQVRRDKKMPVALLQEVDEAIISQAYPIFEVKNEKELLPEYLMMWFTRSEFDREACFHAVGGVRGSLEWEDFENLQLPIPHPDKQKEIVKEYNTIVNRIALNNQLIKKLEETAQAIYREWFVERLDEKRVKSEIKDFGNVVTGKTPSSESPEDFGNEMPFVTPGDFKNYNKFALGAERNLSLTGYSKLKNKILPNGAVIVTCIGSDMGKISIAVTDCITNQQMNSIVVKETFYTDFLYYYLQSISNEIKGIAMGGSTMPMLSKSDFEKIEIIKPEKNILLKFERVMKPMNEMILLHSKEIQNLSELKDLLLSKLATIEN